MALEKMKALHLHIDKAKLVESEKLDSWMEDGKLVPSQQKRGTGIMICQFQYDAIFILENYHQLPELLMAVICAWLVESDGERDDQKLAPPAIDVDMVDDKRADIDIRITFREDIELIEDDNGVISLHGKKYSLANLVDDVVDEVGVGNDQSAPTDLPYKHEE